MHAPLSFLSFAFLVILFLGNLPTTSAWAVAFFEKDNCWGDAYSVHSGDDNYLGVYPEFSKPGENAENQKCYWNKDWGLIQEPCTVATAPVPKSFYQAKGTGCVVGVAKEAAKKFFGKGTPGTCNNFKDFKGRPAFKRDPNIVFRCRSVEAIKKQKPKVEKKIGGPFPMNGTSYPNGTTFSNTTDDLAGGVNDQDDEEWDDDNPDDTDAEDMDVDGEQEVPPEEDVSYNKWGQLISPVDGTVGVD